MAEAALGASARIYPFPQLLSEPLPRRRWRGRYPRGVASILQRRAAVILARERDVAQRSERAKFLREGIRLSNYMRDCYQAELDELTACGFVPVERLRREKGGVQ